MREAEAVEAIPTDPDRNPSATPPGGMGCGWKAGSLCEAVARETRWERSGKFPHLYTAWFAAA